MIWQERQNSVCSDRRICSAAPMDATTTGSTKRTTKANCFPARLAVNDGREIRKTISRIETAISRYSSVVGPGTKAMGLQVKSKVASEHFRGLRRQPSLADSSFWGGLLLIPLLFAA